MLNINIYDNNIFHDEYNDTYLVEKTYSFLYKLCQIQNHLPRYYAKIIFFSRRDEAFIVSFYFLESSKSVPKLNYVSISK
jgi:hypothetical protein